MLPISCVHTADSNVAVFERARDELSAQGVELRHTIRADLLAAAEQAGELSPWIVSETVNALRDASTDAQAVLLTCSTLGPAVAQAITVVPVPVLRVDAALAHAAVRQGGRVAVLCAAATTLDPTRILFEEAASGTGATIEVYLVAGAWNAFKRGDRNRYLAMIAQAADDAYAAGASRVALAQASMAGAARLTRLSEPL